MNSRIISVIIPKIPSVPINNSKNGILSLSVEKPTEFLDTFNLGNTSFAEIVFVKVGVSRFQDTCSSAF